MRALAAVRTDPKNGFAHHTMSERVPPRLQSAIAHNPVNQLEQAQTSARSPPICENCWAPAARSRAPARADPQPAPGAEARTLARARAFSPRIALTEPAAKNGATGRATAARRTAASSGVDVIPTTPASVARRTRGQAIDPSWRAAGGSG
jgi:hypothetical protein